MDDELQAAKDLTYEDVVKNMRSLPSITCRSEESGYYEGKHMMYVHGHMSQQIACTMFSKISETFGDGPCNPNLCYEPGRATILSRHDVDFLFSSFNSADKNSSLVCHYQVTKQFVLCLGNDISCPIVLCSWALPQRIPTLMLLFCCCNVFCANPCSPI